MCTTPLAFKFLIEKGVLTHLDTGQDKPQPQLVGIARFQAKRESDNIHTPSGQGDEHAHRNIKKFAT